MVFVTFGLLVGPVGLNIIQLDVESSVTHILAEATLVLVLFTTDDAKLLQRAPSGAWDLGIAGRKVPKAEKRVISLLHHEGLNDGTG